eukprot:TRINITY_DN4562_c1_g1_i1.p1 TRINITY_DN4562_c1_g1~~TRINITY_DN4562_c1_g1_i1.p1  ORF type:complete len:133 (+),score=35.54 TRINITY_DN4562_c1_g1_i1:74-472(+)
MFRSIVSRASSKQVATSFVARRWAHASVATSAGQVSKNDNWKERENAFESHAAHAHDRELLKKLSETLDAEQKDALARATENIVENAKGGTQAVTQEEFLNLRRDLISRVRALEDEVHDLRLAVAKNTRALK